MACSCFGNNSYCETLSPGWFLNPDATAMVVKLTDYHYGITVKVVQTFGGTSLPNDTLTVWGDNGALCRIYLNGTADGDTMIFGLNETDFMGNFITAGYPPNLEQPGHYMVSVCGVYALNYENGLVSGWISGPFTSSMNLTDFDAFVNACTIGTAVEEEDADAGIEVRYDGGAPVITSIGPMDMVPTTVFDAQGRVVLVRMWDGTPWRLAGLRPGMYAVLVSSLREKQAVKVVVR